MPIPPTPPTPHKYRPPTLDTLENPETYTPGGYHPLSINSQLHTRYKIIHKLGHGGFSTVWLARDRVGERYVALKIGIASLGGDGDELRFLRKLQLLDTTNININTKQQGKNHIIPLLDHFTIEGPNGLHLCLVLQVAGPSLAALNYTPGAVAGSRRLRADLAVKITKQVVQGLEFMHSRGFCHGDLTASNILFKLNDSINTLSEEEIYNRLGHPVTDKIITISASEPGESAPKYLVQPCSFLNSEFFSEEILLVDFGCMFSTDSPPTNLHDIPLTISYAAPEIIFDSKMSIYSDI